MPRILLQTQEKPMRITLKIKRSQDPQPPGAKSLLEHWEAAQNRHGERGKAQ